MAQATEKLVTDVGVLVADTKDLVKATAVETGDKIVEMRGKVEQSIANLRPRLAQAEAVLREKTTVAVNATDNYVHTRPWPAIGMAAGVGLLIGLLIGRH